MSWAFSKSLPDNQEGLRFFFSFIPEDRPLNFPTQSWIPLPDHITFWTDGCITLLQIKRNLKVGKKRLEDCMLKKSRAWVERNLPTNTHTVSWKSHWLFYQNSNVPAHFSTLFLQWWLWYHWSAVTGSHHWEQPVHSDSDKKRHVVIPLSPYLLPDTKERKRQKQKRKFLPGLCNRHHWQFRAMRLHSVTNWYLALFKKIPANHDLLLSNDNRTVRNFSRMNVSGKNQFKCSRKHIVKKSVSKFLPVSIKK